MGRVPHLPIWVPPLQSAAGCEETANRQRGATELQNSISHTNKGGGAKSRIKFWGGVDFCLRVLWQSYVDFILSSPGLVASSVPAPALGAASALEHGVIPAHHRTGPPLPDHQPGDPRTYRS